MQSNTKNTVMSFFLGLLIGYWPIRVANIVVALVVGYLLGDAHHFLSNLKPQQIMSCP